MSTTSQQTTTSQQEFKALLAAVVCTLAEFPGGWAPCSSIYLACKMDVRKFEIVRDVLVNCGLATSTTEIITLTAAGQTLARKINLVINKS